MIVVFVRLVFVYTCFLVALDVFVCFDFGALDGLCWLI